MLVTDESVEFEDKRMRLETLGNMTHRFRGIWEIYLELIKKNRKMLTSIRLDLETLGS
jgi:hypothetical protein